MNFQRNLWIENKIDSDSSKKLAQKLGLVLPISDYLVDKGITSEDNALKFLYPTYEEINKIEIFNGIEEASEVIMKNIKNKKDIMIYGDYDVDGITSTVILYKYLKKLGAKVNYFVPDRHSDGYGLSNEALDTIIDEFDLLITVDCGITSVVEVDYLNEKEKEVIITDHHEPKSEIPNAILVNPKLDKNAFHDYAGVGVVYRLLLELEKITSIPLEKDYLIFAAIGTVADLMTLTEINRLIVKVGLENFKNLNNVGLKELVKQSNLKLDEITSSNIAFNIAPKINASGRLSTAMKAIELFITDNDGTAEKISKELCTLNEERKTIELDILEEAKKQVKADEKFILVKGENWNDGVIGIVASKLVDVYRKPTIVFTQRNGILKGSGRSIGRFNLLKALESSQRHFLRFGGHQFAAGLSLETSEYDDFKSEILEYTNDYLTEEDQQVKLKYISQINSKHIKREFLRQINLLSPFGIGNSKPLFAIKNAYVENLKIVGKEKSHLKLNLNIDNRVIGAIGFNLASKGDQIKKNDEVDLICTLDKNVYLGVEYINLYIKDIRLNAEMQRKESDIIDDVFNYHKNKKNINFQAEIINSLPNREYLVKFYKLLSKEKVLLIKKENVVDNKMIMFISGKIFSDLGFVTFAENSEFAEIKIKNHNQKNKMSLNDSQTYRNTIKIMEDINGY
ncbi:MAG: single-stranded-DNA-specific exonuclease RecJ [Bacillota bacterium]|nr:single-stranded-DNA-specific exonuclease RecJ [Bacillota bacterium]